MRFEFLFETVQLQTASRRAAGKLFPLHGGSVVEWLRRRTCDSVVVSLIPGRRNIGRLALRWNDRLHPGIKPRYVTSHTGQLSLLLSVGRVMSTGQSAVMLCG